MCVVFDRIKQISYHGNMKNKIVLFFDGYKILYLYLKR